MGNHYDPHYEDRMDRRRDSIRRGSEHLKAVNEVAPEDLDRRLIYIADLLSKVEKSVIGGEAIDNLRHARREINALFSIPASRST